jgi:hypothetical protein
MLDLMRPTALSGGRYQADMITSASINRLSNEAEAMETIEACVRKRHAGGGGSG